MIIDVWVWTFAPGKAQEGQDWLLRNMQYHKSQGLKARMLSPNNGLLHRTFYETEHESFDAMEKYISSFFESDAWKDLNSEGWRDFFVQDRTERYQLTVVE